MKALWIALFLVVLIWSGTYPADYPTWILEVSPAIIAFIVLAVTYRTFPLSPLLYTLILIHCIVLMIGGHYTYADVPFFEPEDSSGLQRNNFDKLGHFLQGFVPALAAREVLIRKAIIPSANWRNFFTVCFCLAVSAFYELIEWTVALLSDTAAEAFLGTQGYVWDTQSDMAFALLGAVVALALFGRIQDRQIRNLSDNSPKKERTAIERTNEPD
jgi:putative membrane protein